MHFAIVTFNDREEAAIEALFDWVDAQGAGWLRRGPDEMHWTKGSRSLILRHHPLNSQGNVVAAACLAQFFSEMDDQPDFVIFYGCAGVIDTSLLENVFLVGEVSYASLGTVASGSHTLDEHITLKNKWLCHTAPNEVEPLPLVMFPDVLGLNTLDLAAMTGIPAAHVMATDKVIKVPPSATAPKRQTSGPPHPVYSKENGHTAML